VITLSQKFGNPPSGEAGSSQLGGEGTTGDSKGNQRKKLLILITALVTKPSRDPKNLNALLFREPITKKQRQAHKIRTLRPKHPGEESSDQSRGYRGTAF